jgi:hypothetical protein
VIDEKELAVARDHPRGTERRRLLPYRAALNDVVVYAALPQADRDLVARWAETRRLIKERFGVDRDPANLADPLIAEADLRAHVVRGEAIAANVTDFIDPGGDLMRAVAALRASARPRSPTRSSQVR